MFVLALSAAVLVVATAAPVLAQEDSSDSGLIPAVQIEDSAQIEALPDWTYRYIIPTGLALAAVVILLTSIRYFTNVVRKRYRIVEE